MDYQNSTPSDTSFQHDPLCPFIEDTDGIIYGWNACQCDLIAAVRMDQNKIRPSGRLMFQTGYTSALNEAEVAVAAECHHDDPNEWCVYVEAIRALKEKQ